MVLIGEFGHFCRLAIRKGGKMRALGKIILMIIIWGGGIQSIFAQTMKWSHSFGTDVYCSPAVGDIDGHLGSEIVVGVTDHKLYCFHENGSLAWSYNVGSSQLPYHPAIANINSNFPGPEVLCHTCSQLSTVNGKVVCLSDMGSLIWEKETYNESARPGLTIANIDGAGDPEPEILAGGKNSSKNSGYLYCLTTDGSDKSGFPFDVGADVTVTSPVVVDLDDNGTMEIIFGAGPTVYCIDYTGGTVLWSYTPATGTNNMDAVSVADIDLNGNPEVVVTGTRQIPAGAWANIVYCINSNGSFRWEVLPHTGNAKGISMAAIGDMTDSGGDPLGRPEIAVQSNVNGYLSDSIIVYRDNSSSATEVWREEAKDDKDGSGAAPILYDMNQNGFMDIIWIGGTGSNPGCGYLRIYDVQNNTLLYEDTDFRSETAFEHPAIADIDADGYADIIGIYRNTWIAAITDPAWPPARDQFSSYTYHITNIDENLDIPEYEAPHWKEGRHNTWLAQGFLPEPFIVEGWFDQKADFSTRNHIIRAIDGDWAVGDKGTILKRGTNSNWTSKTLSIGGFTQDDWDFQGVSEIYGPPNIIFIVGAHTKVSTDPDYGYSVSGDRGVILRSIDDGATWDATYSGGLKGLVDNFNVAFYSVGFGNADKGYVGTSGGYVLKTTNGSSSGGATWSKTTQKPVPEGYSTLAGKRHFSDCVRGIWVDKSDPDHVWITTDNRGCAAETRFSGDNWDKYNETPSSYSNMNAFRNFSPAPEGWDKTDWLQPPTNPPDDGNWQDVRQANFGITGVGTNSAYMGISTGGNGLFNGTTWGLWLIDQNSPYANYHPANIMYPTWFMDVWAGKVDGVHTGLLNVATSSAIYNDHTGWHCEYFNKNDDLYTIYGNDENTGWIAWAGGRHPNGTDEEGVIVGKYHEPFQSIVRARGYSMGTKIQFIVADYTKIQECKLYRSVCEEGPFEEITISSSNKKEWTGVWNGINLKGYVWWDNTMSAMIPYWYKVKVIPNDPSLNRVYQYVGPFKTEPWNLNISPAPSAPQVWRADLPTLGHGEYTKYGIVWDNTAPGGEYFIYRSKENSDGPYEYIDRTSDDYYYDATGEVGREYFYTVIACEGAVPSKFSLNEAPPLTNYYAQTYFEDGVWPPQVEPLNKETINNDGVARITWKPVPFYRGRNRGEPYLGGYWVCPQLIMINGDIVRFSGEPHLRTFAPIQRTWYEFLERWPPGAGELGVAVCAIDRSGQSGYWSELSTVPLKGKWYYVDTKTGNDINPGTKEQPFATIQKAATVLQHGEAVAVREGFYHESITPLNSGSTDSGRIFFVAYPGERVVITGDTIRDYGFNVAGKSCIVISGFEIKDCNESGILYDNATSGEVWGNTIYHNNVGVKSLNSSFMVRENTIVANDIGISTNLATGVTFGDTTNIGGGDSPGDNNIYSNATWNILNSAGNSILAQNNYWATGDSATIASTISGPVIFMPTKTILPLDWQIQVKATSTFAVDTSNYAGVVGEASDSCDEGYDIPKYSTPPSDYVYLDFPHPEWNHPLGDKFCQDVRKTVDLTDSTMVWNFEVNTDKSSENITLTINPTDVPSGYGIYLLDLTTGTTQDMKSNPTYVYNSGSGGVREFQLSVGLRGINHGGADWVWTTDSTRTVYDRHYNIGLFKINSGAIMKVTPYDGVDTVTGKLRVESKTMEIVGTLSADSSGFIAESGPGAGVQGTSMHGASGAGYGGRGGHGGSNIQGDTTYHGGYAYGTTSSFLLGSGGGNSDPTLWGKGGRGAGAVKLKCSSSITLSGTLRANGKAGTGSDGKIAGGGSGGSLIIQTVSLAGTGTISAKGGDGAHNPSSGSVDGGGAAGGRINLIYTNSTFTGRIDVSGGEGPYNAIDGQPGTALVQSGDNNVALLSPVNTATNSDSRNGFIKGVELANTWIRLTANDTICGNVELSAQDSIIINSSSYIISSSKGYAHNQGTGYGHAGSSSHGGGGAGYGGIGGHGSYYTPGGIGDGGITYPDSLLPDSLGSGGGDYADLSGYRWGGGAGGGKIKLTCSYGEVLINGTLQTNGANGISKTSYASGGGAGGSVLIYAKHLAGTGTIEAKGGNGGAIAGCYAGGGAGGRICLYRDSTDFSGSVSADGGLKGGYGATDGAPGTINEDYVPYGGGTQGNPLKKPIVFKLYQNYPNPFMNRTTIKYSIPKTTKVSLKIYDISGRCVKTLVDGSKVPGYYKESLEARDYPTGVYFMRLQTNEYKETKKMVLMR